MKDSLQMSKIPVFLLSTKVGLFVVTFIVCYLISSPYPVCWKKDELPTNSTAVDDSTERLKYVTESGETCVTTKLFENFMCAADPWKDPWWAVKLSNPFKFCIARTSTYMAIFTQLCLVCFVQLLHLFFLTKRSFINYDPLDMIPAFLTISAFSSVLIIQIMLSSNWSDLWETNKLAVPSLPLPHTALTCILSAGIGLAAIDWILYHRAYNTEQDLIEEKAKASNMTHGSSGSDKEHED